MTDQRPIDVTTLRDGDIVRAKRGEHGVVEGVFCRTGRGGWCLHDGPTSARETAWSADCWTITSIIRPVLVKGDRVEWTNVVTPKQGTYVGPHEGGRPGEPHLSVVTNADGRDVVVETCLLTRLPAAPEPVPIEVGDWWADEEGVPHVVLGKQGGNLTVRSWLHEGAVTQQELWVRDHWTRLDGPPEPPVGSVYVLVGIVWHHQAEGHVPASPVRVNGPWAGIRTWVEQRSSYNVRQLATLHILGTVD